MDAFEKNLILWGVRRGGAGGGELGYALCGEGGWT